MSGCFAGISAAACISSRRSGDSGKAGTMLDRLSNRSREDLTEWFAPEPDIARKVISNFLKTEITVQELLAPSSGDQAGGDAAVEITDDQPYNEYYKLRTRQ